VIIACLDVDYREAGARAACVVIDSWTAAKPVAAYTRDIEDIQPYEPGNFYRRELPCLLSVLQFLPERPDVVVVDGYVWLSSTNRPGLGAHLHAALDRGPIVVGVAKTAFVGVGSSAIVVAVERGISKNPLYVTSVGIDPEVAASWIRSMAGRSRIPDILQTADQLARSK
jgi:deoxyribonuclease V